MEVIVTGALIKPSVFLWDKILVALMPNLALATSILIVLLVLLKVWEIVHGVDKIKLVVKAPTLLAFFLLILVLALTILIANLALLQTVAIGALPLPLVSKLVKASAQFLTVVATVTVKPMGLQVVLPVSI